MKQIIRQGFLRCLSRLPDQQEIEITERLYQEQLTHFGTHAEDAEKLLVVGHSPHRPEVPAAAAAASTVLMQVLLNHDECVVKR